VWATFEKDLALRGVEAKRPADPVTDEAWMTTLGATYIEEPVTG